MRDLDAPTHVTDGQSCTPPPDGRRWVSWPPSGASAARAAAVIAFAAIAWVWRDANVWSGGDSSELSAALLVPTAAAASVVALVQVVAALVGRGRGAPGASLVRIARPILLGLATLVWVFILLDRGASRASLGSFLSPIRMWDVHLATAALIGTGVITVLSIEVGRRGGVSVLAPLVLVASAMPLVMGAFRHGFELWIRGPVEVSAGNLLVSVAIPLVALALLKPRREDLARLGVTPWAVGDLALVGPLLLIATVMTYETVFESLTSPGAIVQAAVDDLCNHRALCLPAAALATGLVRRVSALARKAARHAERTPGHSLGRDLNTR